MTWDAGSFGLHSLRSSDLQTFGRDERIQSHILRFERGRMITVLPKNATETRSDNTLAYIAACADKHNRP